jgi:hypothetical protein
MTFPLLQGVAGGLTLMDWKINGLPSDCSLTSIRGFPSLTIIGATFRMYLTDYVETIDAFPLLQTVVGELAIHDMRSLTTIKPFSSLTKIGGLRLFWLKSITDLQFMDTVTDLSDGNVVSERLITTSLTAGYLNDLLLIMSNRY